MFNYYNKYSIYVNNYLQKLSTSYYKIFKFTNQNRYAHHHIMSSNRLLPSLSAFSSCITEL